MRIAIGTFILATVCGNAVAAFSCEQIKDKSTRSACIADRTSKEKEDLALKEKAAAEERQRADAAAAESEKAKELDEFVRKSKAALTKYFKDPAGAQFTDLVVSQDAIQRALCGSVNGKNSYGAYVGAKRFYVTWMTALNGPRTWTEFESTAEYRRSKYPSVLAKVAELEAIEDKQFSSLCEQNASNTVVKIDK